MFQSLRKLRSRYPTCAAGSRPAIRRAIEPIRCEALESRQLLAAITLAGSVYQDLNNNGKVEAGEAGIANVTITLTGKTDGHSDGHSDGGNDCKTKSKECGSHPDNGNNKNVGCGNAYGVPNRDAKSQGKGR